MDKKTGLKPILQYAVARSRLVDKATRWGRAWEIARQAQDQCSIGFQPVFVRTIDDIFQEICGDGYGASRSRPKPLGSPGSDGASPYLR